PQLAAWRQMVPLHVEHRGQGGRISRHVADEPLRLLDCRPAEIEEMIRSAWNARLSGGLPVSVKIIVQPVTAFGGLDEGKGDPVGSRCAPVDIGLVFGDIRSMHGIAPRLPTFPGMWFPILKAGAVAKRHVGRRRRDQVLVADARTGSHRQREANGYGQDRKSTRLNSSHVKISYAVFCLKKKNITVTRASRHR